MKTLFKLLFLFLLSAPAFAEEAGTATKVQDAYSRSYNYERLENYRDAINALMAVHQEYPNGYTVNLRLGWLYYLNGSYANSLFHYETAMKAADSSIEAKLGYVLPLMAQEKWNDAELVLYKVLKVDYYNYYGNLRLSHVLVKQRKFDLAEKVVKKMLTLLPTDISFLEELAVIKKETDRKAELEALVNDLLTLEPENVIAKQMKAETISKAK